MTFYQELSAHYDRVFPVNPKEMEFVNAALSGKRRLLDIGCGTGNKTELLCPGREEVVGVDMDEEMVAAANDGHRPANAVYRVMDMTRVEDYFPAGHFDAVTCLGNTLPHLARPGEVEDFVGQVAMITAPRGIFVVQIVNYDRILDRKVDTLPLIDNDSVRFVRKYVWRDGKMHFVSELTVKKTGAVFANDIVLRPLRKKEVDAALAAAGFADAHYYGGYDGGAPTGDSFHLIAVAGKGSE